MNSTQPADFDPADSYMDGWTDGYERAREDGGGFAALLVGIVAGAAVGIFAALAVLA